jgi:hypothetical protein
VQVTIQCHKCKNGRLYFDYHGTFNDYFRASNYLSDDKGKLVEDSIQMFLVYTCNVCRKEFRLTFKEVEDALRKEIAGKVYELQAALYIKENFEASDVTNNNVMILCGECRGFDGEGRCPDSFYNRCILRKKTHAIQLP